MGPFATFLVSLDSRVVYQSVADSPLRRAPHVLVVTHSLNVEIVDLAWDPPTYRKEDVDPKVFTQTEACRDRERRQQKPNQKDKACIRMVAFRLDFVPISRGWHGWREQRQSTG